jgi:hypothetical protein
MPGNWDPQVYRARAKQWRAEADKMPPGENRDAYITTSESYANPHDSPHFPSAQVLRRFASIPYQIREFVG